MILSDRPPLPTLVGALLVFAACSSDPSDEGTKKQRHAAETACEHVNGVCATTQGFQKKDCSTSRAEYETLSDSDKQIADAIVPCIMSASTCASAFQCLGAK